MVVRSQDAFHALVMDMPKSAIRNLDNAFVSITRLEITANDVLEDFTEML
jgi:hypothetical protein